MSEQKSPQSLERFFRLVVLVSILVLAGGVVSMNFRLDSLSDKVTKLTPKSNSTNEDHNNTGWNTTLKSGKGGFEMTVPDGWGPMLRDTTSDWLIMLGTTQPTVKVGEKVVVNDIGGYGSDSLSLFSVSLADNEFAPPQGVAEEFTFNKNEEAIVGKKYTYTYPKDDIIGIGYQRFQGDRDYEYVFQAGDKQLHVFYAVHGSDPRNLIETVDRIVQSIRLL